MSLSHINHPTWGLCHPLSNQYIYIYIFSIADFQHISTAAVLTSKTARKRARRALAGARGGSLCKAPPLARCRLGAVWGAGRGSSAGEWEIPSKTNSDLPWFLGRVGGFWKPKVSGSDPCGPNQGDRALRPAPTPTLGITSVTGSPERKGPGMSRGPGLVMISRGPFSFVLSTAKFWEK